MHTWGAGNRVSFEAQKESVHVLSHTKPEGGNFKVLGVEWDPKLLMHDAAETLVREAKWKVLQLLRARRYFSVAQLLKLYKSHVPGFVEYRTPALYHASDSVLTPLDQFQEWVLRDLGLTELEALEHFHLAPLSTRRNIAMLGVVWRAVRRKGPPQLWSFFEKVPDRRTTRSSEWHNQQLKTYRDGNHLAVLRRSVLGLVEVFNLLPPAVVEGAETVKSFQAQLQELTLEAGKNEADNWKTFFSAGQMSWELRELRRYSTWKSSKQVHHAGSTG